MNGMGRHRAVAIVVALGLALIGAAGWPSASAQTNANGVGTTPADTGSAGSVQAVALGSLVILNQGFEGADAAGYPLSWTKGPACSAMPKVTTATAHGRSRSLLLSDPTKAGNPCVVSSANAVMPGDTLTLTANLRLASGAAAWLSLRFYNAAGALISAPRLAPTGAHVNLDYFEPVMLTASVPAGATTVKVMFYGSTVSVGSTYIDDVVLFAHRYSPTIGSSRQLLMDPYRIASRSGVQLVADPGIRSGVTLGADKPWETENHVYGGTILVNPDLRRYQAFYNTYSPATNTQRALYAESANGVTWTKPALNLIPFNGSTANNLTMSTWGGTVLYTPWDPDPARKYKMLTLRPSPIRGYYAFFSPDGTHWTQYGTRPVILNSDTSNLSWDQARRRYVAVTRQPMRKVPISHENRSVFISFSKDFITWTLPVLTFEADQGDTARARARGGVHADGQVYGFSTYNYDGTWLGMPWIFYVYGPFPGYDEGTIETFMATSHDLAGPWSRPTRTPILPLMPNGDRDSGMVMPSSQLIVTDTEVRLYYTAWNGSHGTSNRQTATSYRTWRRDGFASLNAGATPGTVVTKPIVLPRGELRVNVVGTNAAGYLKAEILQNGVPIPGYRAADMKPATRQNAIQQTVTWSGGSLNALAGRTVQIRFSLRSAKFYSYWVK